MLTRTPGESFALFIAILAITILSMAAWINSTSKSGDPKYDLYLTVVGIALILGAAHALRSAVRIEWDDRARELVINRRWLWSWVVERFHVQEASILIVSMSWRRWPWVIRRRPSRYLIAIVLKEKCVFVSGYSTIDDAIQACSRLERKLGKLSYRWNEVSVVLWTAMYLIFLGLHEDRYSVYLNNASPPTATASELLRFDSLDEH
jgi:hypothetical protein